jgi:proteasome activator subunit 4
MLPDLSSLRINGKPTHRTINAAGQPIPEDLESTRDSRYMRKLQEYAKSLPYSIEPYSKIIEILDFILLRLTQSIEAKDYDIGFMQWDSMLT